MKVPTILNAPGQAPQLTVQGIGGAANTNSPAYIGQGLDAISRVVDKARTERDAEQARLDKFELDKTFLEEAVTTQAGFNAATEAHQDDPSTFAATYAQGLAEKHSALVEEMRGHGYKEEDLNAFDINLTRLRGEQFGNALNFQNKAEQAKARTELDATADTLGLYVKQNPLAVEAAHNQWNSFVDNQVRLTDLDREELRASGWEKIRTVGAQVLAMDDPELIISELDPDGKFARSEFAAPAAQGTAPSGPFSMSSYLQRLSPVEGTAKNPSSSAKGHFQFLDSTWKQYYARLYGNKDLTPAQILAKRGERGTAEAIATAFTNDNIAKLQGAGLPVDNATVYLTHFLGGDTAVKLLKAGSDAPIAEVVGKAARDANGAVFKNVRTAGDLLTWAQGKMGVAAQRAPVSGNNNGQRYNADGAPLPVATEQVNPEIVVNGIKPTDGPLVPIKTGNPALDALHADEQLRVVGQAYTQRYNNEARATAAINAADREREAQLKAAHDEKLNSLLNGLNDGTQTRASIDQARREGWLTDYDDINKAEGILGQREKVNTDLARYSAFANDGVPANPYDKADVDAVEAGFAESVKFAQANGIRTTPLHIGAEIWAKTGVVPKQLATLLRGGLASPDPTTVGYSSSVAMNMLAKNRNVFAGVTGESDIVKAADNYAYQINVLGRPAKDAAIQVANLNNPAVKTALGENDPARVAFAKTLTGSGTTSGVNITNVLNSALGTDYSSLNPFSPSRPTFANERVKAEAARTYSEIAMQHFEQFRDPGAAQHHAEREMSRFYGVNNGRIMKFPPNNAYPLVGGSQDYILNQAREEVVKLSGLDIPIGQVWLEPSPDGRTAEAFRNGQRVPYEVHYLRHVNGHEIYDVVKGAGGKPRLFVADVERARRELGTARIGQQRGTQNNQRLIEQTNSDLSVFGGL